MQPITGGLLGRADNNLKANACYFGKRYSDGLSTLMDRTQMLFYGLYVWTTQLVVGDRVQVSITEEYKYADEYGYKG